MNDRILAARRAIRAGAIGLCLASLGTPTALLACIRTDRDSETTYTCQIAGRPISLGLSVDRSSKDEAVERALLREGDRVLLEAVLTITRSGLRFAGRLDEDPFVWAAESRWPHRVVSTRSWGDLRLSAEVDETPAGTLTVRLTEGDLGAYLLLVSGRTASAVLQAVEWIAAEAAPGDFRVLALRSALRGLTMDTHGGSPVGRYLGCLEDTCRACRGCWEGGCHCCHGDPWWACATIWTCYLVGSELCVLQEINDLTPKLR
ncbi:MAG: hypothetical protein D6718_07670 [Acidobacteria bacterium]|nr:MAG: hypothetical protein D6718_07670 [Acidobacteriota bacterium]